MVDAYTKVGDDLHNFVTEIIDISEVEPAGWANTFNRIFQPDEATNCGYPA